MRQNTESLRTENYARVLDRISAIQSQLGQDGELARLFSRGSSDASKLTSQERVQLTWCLYETFGAFEFMFHAAQTRALPQEVWIRWSSTVAYWMSLPGVQSWWQARPTPFSSSFTAFVDEQLRKGPVDPDANRRWQEYVGHDPAS